MKKIKLLSTILLLCTVIPAARSQKVYDLGSVPFLSIPADARTSGMALTGTGYYNGAFSIFNNAATSLTGYDRFGVGYTYQPWTREFVDKSAINVIGGFYNINDKNGLSVGMRFFKSPEGIESDDQGQVLGKYTPKDFAIDLAYTRHIVSNFYASLTVRYISSDPAYSGADKGSAVAFDLGLFYKKEIRGMSGANWAAGLNLNNIGSKMKYGDVKNDLPGKIKAGGSVYLPFSTNQILMAAVDVKYQITPSDASLFEAGIGAEYNFYEYGLLRAGYHIGSKDKGYGNFLTLGAGAKVGPVRADFAYWITESDSPLKNTFCISASVVF